MPLIEVNISNFEVLKCFESLFSVGMLQDKLILIEIFLFHIEFIVIKPIILHDNIRMHKYVNNKRSNLDILECKVICLQKELEYFILRIRLDLFRIMLWERSHKLLC